MAGYREAKNGLFLRLYHLFRRLQQANRFIIRDMGTELGITESSLLVDIGSRDSTAQELSELLKIDKSVVSRNIASLAEMGLVQSVRSSEDKRSKVLTVTSAGKRFLKRYDEHANRIIGERFALLSDQEQEELIHMIRHFADAAGAAVGFVRENEHPLRIEIRRITAVLGLLRKSFMGSSLNVAQWQVLAELEQEAAEANCSHIARKLSISPSSVSTILAILESKKCIARPAAGKGRSSSTVSLTQTGSNILRHIEERYCGIIAKGYSDVPDHKLHVFENIFGKYLGLSGMVARDGTSEVFLLKTKEELRKARAFLVENLILFRKHLELPSRIMAEDSLCYALYDQGILKAVAETFLDDGAIVLVNYAAAPSNLEFGRQKLFVEKVLELSRAAEGISKVTIPPHSLAREILHGGIKGSH